MIGRDAKLKKNLSDNVVNLVLQGVCTVIEGEHGRNDCTPQLGSAEHVAQMDPAQGHFAGDQYKTTIFLEADVGGTKKQVFRISADDTGERLHTAGHDDHAVGHKGAAGDDGYIVVLFIDMIRLYLHSFYSLRPARQHRGLLSDLPIPLRLACL